MVILASTGRHCARENGVTVPGSQAPVGESQRVRVVVRGVVGDRGEGAVYSYEGLEAIGVGIGVCWGGHAGEDFARAEGCLVLIWIRKGGGGVTRTQ